MAKILLAFVLLILGVVSCIGAPVMFAVGLMPETVAEIRPGGEARVQIEEQAGYLVLVTWPKGSDLRIGSRHDLPTGDYGFRPSGGGELMRLEQNGSFQGSTMGTAYVSIGGATLAPGAYDVVTPELPEGVGLEIARSRMAESPEGVLGMGAGVLLGMALGGLLLLAAAVMLILGIVEAARGKRQPQD